MTSTLAGPSTDRPLADGPTPPLPVLTGLDVLALGCALVVALLGWASLTLAHVGRHALPAVIALTLIGMAAVGATVAFARTRVRVRPDVPGILVALLCAGVAAVLTVPGFSYGVADKDPGGYVSHAVEIAHSGDYAFTDPILHDHLEVQLTSPGARFAGVWVRDVSTGRIVPQFYHLWPALLATAFEVDGYTGLRVAVPLAGVLAVLCMVALLRRVGNALAPGAGVFAALAGGLLLATNMLEVWQSRFPTTEVLAEALYLAALLGVVTALQTGWRPAAGLAGLFVGVGWLNRADGLLLVLLSAGVGAAFVATRRWDGRATWFTAGLAVVTPHALLQAYDLAHNYSLANDIPPLSRVVAVIGGVFLVAALLRLAARRPVGWLTGLLERRRTQVVLGLLVCGGAFALLLVGFLRPRLFGPAYFSYNGLRIRSYDESILRRLAWFFTLPGFAVMGLGVAVVALRRWSATLWAVVLPSLAFLAVYGYTAKNSTRLLWWTRRYVPTVLPAFVLLVAIALAFAFAWRTRRGRPLLRLPAIATAAALIAVFVGQSRPVSRHDEWQGSFEVTAALSQLSGDARGLYLWEPQQGCCAGPTQLFATPLWLAYDELSVLLPINSTQRARIIDLYARHFPDSPVFIVGDRPELPAGVDPRTVLPVLSRHVDLPMWDESDERRPDRAHQVPVDIAVWRVRGT